MLLMSSVWNYEIVIVQEKHNRVLNLWTLSVKQCISNRKPALKCSEINIQVMQLNTDFKEVGPFPVIFFSLN